MSLESAASEPAGSQQFSVVRPSPWEVEVMGMQVALGVEGPSRGGMLQIEKSGGVRHGGGTTYPGIPPMGVLRSVTPLEVEVTPYPWVC